MRTREAPIRNFLEFALAKMVVGIAWCLPSSALPILCRSLGALTWLVIGSRRQVVQDNLVLAYPDPATRPDARAVGVESIANLLQSFLELFLSSDDPNIVRAQIEQVRGVPLHELVARHGGGPFIWAASHFGAWEVLGSSGPLLGFEVTTLVRPLDNPLIQAWVARRRTRFGARLAASRGGLADLMSSLDAGRQVAVLADLNHRGRGAEFIQFFGVPAATARTVAVLALRSRRPVVPVFCGRLPGGRFGIDVGEPIVPDPNAPFNAEIHRILQEVAKVIESRIRAHPGAWLWTHRRWKSRPEAVAMGEGESV